MYRILAILCVVALLALAGCGDPGPAVNETTAPGDVALTPTQTPPPADGTPTVAATTPTGAALAPPTAAVAAMTVGE